MNYKSQNRSKSSTYAVPVQLNDCKIAKTPRQWPHLGPIFFVGPILTGEDMASITKTKKGYRAQIKLLGVRDSNTFEVRRDAVDWAIEREAEIRNSTLADVHQGHTLLTALRKYSEEESPKKRGAAKERIRLKAFERYLLPLDKAIADVTSTEIALFRDSRLKSVKPSSVLRELGTLSSVFQVAKLEWKWVSSNPVREISKPPKGRHRERVYQPWEVKMLLRGFGYAPRGEVSTKFQRVALNFMVAMRTGMRAGELCSLAPGDMREDYCRLDMTKNSDAREVPLSTKARRLLAKVKGKFGDNVLGLNTSELDSNFRLVRDDLLLEGCKFHDTRHTAATMIAKKVDMLTLCKIFGWRDPRYALVYYNPKASSIAAKLG